MDDTHIFPGGLEVEHHISENSAVLRVGGPLTFPDAVAVEGVVNHVLEYEPSLVLIDLTSLGKVDSTGVAVLVAIGIKIKEGGAEVRVVAADPRIRHRLPYTLGLRKVFRTVDEAMLYRP